MDYTEFVSLAWRIYDIAILTAEGMGWIAFIFGGIGYALNKSNPARGRRFRGLLFGGGAALVTVLFVGGAYEATTFIMTGQIGGVDSGRAIHSQFYLENTDVELSTLLALSSAISQIAAIIGMSAFAFGFSLRGISKQRSIFQRKSKRIIYGGIALMVFSVGGQIFSATSHVFVHHFLT